MPVAFRDARCHRRARREPVRARGATLVLRRRGLLAGLAALALGMSAGAPQIVAAFGSTRTISLYHIHTKETLTVTYKKDGKYVASALKQINWHLRDWRVDEATAIDPKAIDLLWEMHTELGSKKPIHIISGYRSKKTNNMLRRTRGGQAKKSFHILGRAIDAAFPDVPVKRMRYSALVRERGGVGYYPTSGIPFVHIDTGRVRAWPRLPRHELALLFPNGKTKHRPKKGGPITRKDVRIARARHKKMAAQVAAYFDIRNGKKAPTPVAIAAAPALTQPPSRAARPSARQIAALPPAARPARQPRLKATPQLLRASALPSRADRRQLDKLVNLASLTASQPRLLPEPPPDRDKLSQLIADTLDQAPRPAAPAARSLRARGQAERRVAALPRKTPDSIEAILSETDSASWRTSWAPAPEFDDEHPEELSYRPFPIAPFLTQSSSPDDRALVALVHPDVARTLELLDDRSIMLPMRLRPGQQMAEALWAQQSRGDAIDMSVLGDAERSDRAAPDVASQRVKTMWR